MIKTLSIIAVVLLLAQNASFFYKAKQSRQGKVAGLVDGKLIACGSRPNCVSSETGTDPKHLTEGFEFAGQDPEQLLALLEQQLIAMGGEVVASSYDYRGFEFRSRFYGFVDDVELRLDRENQMIQIRSGSRVGYSDLGANHRRVETLRQALGELHN